MTTDNMNQLGFLRLTEVLEIFPVSKSTWWQGIKDGKFPQPVKLSTRISAWKVSDINQLLEKLGGSDNGHS